MNRRIKKKKWTQARERSRERFNSSIFENDTQRIKAALIHFVRYNEQLFQMDYGRSIVPEPINSMLSEKLQELNTRLSSILIPY